MNPEQIKNLIRDTIKKETGFIARKLTDTPTDALQVVNRKYVTLNGTIASRPASTLAIMGQHYYASDINIPLTYDSANSVWRNGIGSIIASN